MTRIRRLLVLSILALVCACSGSAPTEDVAAAEQEILFCDSPPGRFVIALPLAPLVDVTRARFLVEKMSGVAYPLKGTCATQGSCAAQPGTCSVAQCDAGQCPGWTCHEHGLPVADDGRVGALVASDATIDARFAQEPGNRLSLAESLELGVFRTASVMFADFSCWGF
jgi:hypothetical protein